MFGRARKPYFVAVCVYLIFRTVFVYLIRDSCACTFCAKRVCVCMVLLVWLLSWPRVVVVESQKWAPIVIGCCRRVVATVVVVVVCMAFVFRTMLVIQVCRVRACGGDLLVVRDRSSTGVLRIVVVAVARVHGRGSDLGGGVAVE